MFLMNSRVLWGSVVVAFILSIAFYPYLPADMPIHYDVTIQPDMSINKIIGVLVLPVLMIVFMFLRNSAARLCYVVYVLLILHIVVLWLALP
ncbi:DUF1648 domain-containing protein [Bacillus atrophaeus]|uniref:DUF1648 domain-containing protein n=1 Tax=Bacillus atrophaeus TaxID=1452 RepID=UPI00227E1D7E|nr:DUF1648 domain-containing protein [Bacillus atrophaeus]MCY8515526.1 DUF1648 domain-containing protein [Bacillus atrophaeus]MCY8992763.1 DUF1648 domain-containing protein [Bacillus atrophaeus]